MLMSHNMGRKTGERITELEDALESAIELIELAAKDVGLWGSRTSKELQEKHGLEEDRALYQDRAQDFRKLLMPRNS